MPQLERALIKARAARLREAASDALTAHLSRHIGETRQVLAEANGQGRLSDFTPVTDLPDHLPHGEFASLKITGQREGRLTGVVA